jgi:hypothetical protein
VPMWGDSLNDSDDELAVNAVNAGARADLDALKQLVWREAHRPR